MLCQLLPPRNLSDRLLVFFSLTFPSLPLPSLSFSLRRLLPFVRCGRRHLHRCSAGGSCICSKDRLRLLILTVAAARASYPPFNTISLRSSSSTHGSIPTGPGPATDAVTPPFIPHPQHERASLGASTGDHELINRSSGTDSVRPPSTLFSTQNPTCETDRRVPHPRIRAVGGPKTASGVAVKRSIPPVYRRKRTCVTPIPRP